VSLFGGNGDDTFDTGAAYDGTQAVTLIGGAGADSLLGRNQADSIVGGAGNDVINGRGGADNLYGGDDNDTFLFSAAGELAFAATVAGDAGTDTISFSTDAFVADGDFTNVDSVEALLFANGVGSTVDINTEARLGGIVSLYGGTGNDNFFTGAAYDGTQAVTLIGGAGNDDLRGRDQADSIVGDDGDDRIAGEGGADRLDGGADNDTFTFRSAAALNAAATITGGSGIDTISIVDIGSAVVDSDLDKVDLVETLVFNAGGNCSAVLDTEAQLGGIVSVFGGVGNDTFTAGTAYDGTSVTLVGNDGADQLTGANAADRIYGDDGADILQGFGTVATNTNNDTLTGGAGADVFVFGTNTQNAYPGNPAGDSGVVYITDFEVGVDSINLFQGLTNPIAGAFTVSEVFPGTGIYGIADNLTPSDYAYTYRVTGATIELVDQSNTANVLANISFTGNGAQAFNNATFL
jgi:Ca2+-binding RTX toxin-like protein